MGTHAAATQLSLLTPQDAEATRPSSLSRAKRKTKLAAASLKPAPPKPGEAGSIERRSGRRRRPPGSGGRRATDRVEARPAEAARAAAPPASAPPPNAPLPPENELWDLRAAARFLKMSTSWVYKRVEDGSLPVTRVNGYSLRFDPAALREWVAKNATTRRAVKRNKK